MKVSIDADSCIGCGLCTSDCPEVFEMKAEKAVPKAAIVPAGKEDSCKNAATNCPVQCIKCE